MNIEGEENYRSRRWDEGVPVAEHIRSSQGIVNSCKCSKWRFWVLKLKNYTEEHITRRHNLANMKHRPVRAAVSWTAPPPHSHESYIHYW